MQLLNSEAEKLTSKIIKQTSDLSENLELILCPSHISLFRIEKKIKDTKIKIGAQNVWFQEKGAYTGEISPTQLKELGTEFVILGHSERRAYQNETDEEINSKTKTCLANKLTPIICVGETLDERQAQQTDLTLIRQTTKALEGIKILPEQKIIMAYEPVWVIGSGQAISEKDAEHAYNVIYQTLLDNFSSQTVKDDFVIIYGGSVDETNVQNFVKENLFDGALVGGASLTIKKFLPLIQLFS